MNGSSQSAGVEVTAAASADDGLVAKPRSSASTLLCASPPGGGQLLREVGSTVVLNVYLPELEVRRRHEFDVDENLWIAKIRLLASLEDGGLRDGLNCSFYLPPANGRAGKFLDDERPLRDYPLSLGEFLLEFKHKRRIYRQQTVSRSKLQRLHTRENFKLLINSVKSRALDKITKLLSKGLDPNFHDAESGETPLTTAVTLSDCHSIVATLVGSGSAHLDFRNRQSLTPMHVAAACGNADAITVLLELGASPNSKDRKGLTPLFYLSASRLGSVPCAELLLRDFATIGCQDQLGCTELHQACKNGHLQLAEMLAFYGADMNARNSDGFTPLHSCVAANQIPCLKMMLSRGANRQVADLSGHTPLQAARLLNKLEAAAVLEGHDDSQLRNAFLKALNLADTGAGRMSAFDSLGTYWKGLGSKFLAEGVQIVAERLISEVTPFPRELNRHTSIKRIGQHVTLKALAFVVATPFIAASFVDSVRSEIASESSSLLECSRMALTRVISWSATETARMLPIWKVVLPVAVHGLLHYSISSLTRYSVLLAAKSEPFEETEDKPAIQLLYDAYFPDLVGSFAGSMLADIALFPLETIIHRMLIQGTRSIIDNTDTGLGVLPVNTHYSGFFSCLRAIMAHEGVSGFYKGFGALLIQYAVHALILRLSHLLYRRIADEWMSSPPPGVRHPVSGYGNAAAVGVADVAAVGRTSAGSSSSSSSASSTISPMLTSTTSTLSSRSAGGGDVAPGIMLDSPAKLYR